MQKIATSDVLIFIGLTQQGAGLFFWFDAGVSAAVVGTELLLMGLFGKK